MSRIIRYWSCLLNRTLPFLQRKAYDLAFGIGASCHCSISLRKAKLQHLSFPGDWIVPTWKCEELPTSNLVHRVSWLCQGMDGFLDPEDFLFVRKHEDKNKDVYANARTHYLFPHDFPTGRDFKEEFPAFAAKYTRRYNRLISLIRGARRVFVLRLDHPNGDRTTSLADLDEAHAQLCKAFPGVQFDFAFFQCNPAQSFSRRTLSHPRPWLTHVTFDYRVFDHPEDPHLPDQKLVAKALKLLARVRDYRTDEERAAYAGKEKW